MSVKAKLEILKAALIRLLAIKRFIRFLNLVLMEFGTVNMVSTLWQ